MTQSKKMKRIVLYVFEEDYILMRSKLILLGLTVSEWFRKKIRQFLIE